MPIELLNLSAPFIVSAISSAISLAIFKIKPHSLENRQIIAFWIIVSMTFFLMSLLPQQFATLPFLFFFLQGIVVYLTVIFYWKLRTKKAVIFTLLYSSISLVVIVALGFLLRGLVG